MSDLRPLRDWLASHPSPDEPVATLHLGVPVSGEGASVLGFPWHDYGPALPTFWEAVRATDWEAADTQDYMTIVDRWLGAAGADRLQPAHFARMDRATLYNALRWLDRGERFSDGLWARAFQDGLLHAAARALIALG